LGRGLARVWRAFSLGGRARVEHERLIGGALFCAKGAGRQLRLVGEAASSSRADESIGAALLRQLVSTVGQQCWPVELSGKLGGKLDGELSSLAEEAEEKARRGETRAGRGSGSEKREKEEEEEEEEEESGI